MVRPAIYFLIFTFTSFLSNGQVRTITGKVIDEFDLSLIPGVKIQSRDTVLLGTTDRNGNFEIQLPPNMDELLLSFIGMEWTSIKILSTCDKLEIIMMVDANYDFISTHKINRKRYRKFKDLSNWHNKAYKKGIFTSNIPCFKYIFHKY